MHCPSDLKAVLEANLRELLHLRLSDFPSPAARLYGELLVRYFQCDLAGLEDLEDALKSQSWPERPILLSLLKLRTAIRRREIPTHLIDELRKISKPDSIWEAEARFVIAMAYETLERNELARDAYLQASRGLTAAGCPRKASKALLNYVVAESRAYPDKKLIPDYLLVATLARKAGELGVAGTALMNISREYQKLGALELALKYCNQALPLLEPEEGALPFNLALAHRCHVFLDLRRESEALLDYQRAGACDLKEVQQALRVIDVLRQKSGRRRIHASDLTPTWRERLRELEDRPAIRRPGTLTQLEQHVIELVSKGPQTKFDIIHALYGDRMSFSATENRLKVLLSRLRRKRPGLVVRNGDHYVLADEVFLERLEA